MDLSQSIVPKSDQINAEDLLTGPRTFTIEKVEPGSAEQPVNIHLVELPGRPYRPSKSMLRVLVSAWGAEASEYAGRRLTLFRNPEIKFGGATVGGIEISEMSHIKKRLTVSLMVTRGKRKPFSVDPLPDAPKPDTTIPADVVSNTAKALADGALDDYLAWLTENNAPAHILQYVNEQRPA
jgi:hypothetical protein